MQLDFHFDLHSYDLRVLVALSRITDTPGAKNRRYAASHRQLDQIDVDIQWVVLAGASWTDDYQLGTAPVL